jgi:hypothetical protein
MMLMVMLFVMCVLWNHMSSSGDFYYTMDTAQFDYAAVDEVIETVAANWRGLQEKDVSFKMVATYLSNWWQHNFQNGNYVPFKMVTTYLSKWWQHTFQNCGNIPFKVVITYLSKWWIRTFQNGATYLSKW